MHLIFGGSYQGQLEYAKGLLSAEAGTDTAASPNCDASKIYTFPSSDDCQTPEECLAMLDPAKAIGEQVVIVDHLERFVYACAAEGRDAVAYVKSHPELFEGRYVLADDVSQGVVPLDQTERAWREMNGRVLAYLATQAESVTRVFCGLPQRIK